MKTQASEFELTWVSSIRTGHPVMVGDAIYTAQRNGGLVVLTPNAPNEGRNVPLTFSDSCPIRLRVKVN